MTTTKTTATITIYQTSVYATLRGGREVRWPNTFIAEALGDAFIGADQKQAVASAMEHIKKQLGDDVEVTITA